MSKQMIQCLKGIKCLFTICDDKASYSCKLFCTLKTSEASGYFLYDFHHSQILFGEAIVEWYVKVKKIYTTLRLQVTIKDWANASILQKKSKNIQIIQRAIEFLLHSTNEMGVY